MYGTFCRYVRVSASFSVARCSSPMCGSARCTISPSSSSTSRSTPCAAGCCGPKFSVQFLMSATTFTPPVRRPVPLLPDHPLHDLPCRNRHRLIDHTLLFGVVAHLDVPAD